MLSLVLNTARLKAVPRKMPKAVHISGRLLVSPSVRTLRGMDTHAMT